MITVISGLPGSGKTLFALQNINTRSIKENRPVFFDGINGLTLPWHDLENKTWVDVPEGSIVVIDEAQRRYRPRGQGAAVPAEVAAFETHRHKGLDIYLITQHPMNIDSNVRRLVGSHYHVMRKFGSKRATVHEFTAINDAPDKSRKDSIRHEWKYPADYFDKYKSAEVHTHKFRLPMRVWVLMGLPLLLIPLVWKAGTWFYDASTGKKNEIYSGQKSEKSEVVAPSRGTVFGKGAAVAVGSVVGSVYADSESYYSSHKPIIEGLPATAPSYQELSKPLIVPVVTACIAIKDRCLCYSQQSTRIAVPYDQCREIALHGVPFQDFKVGRLEEPSAPASPVGNIAPKASESADMPVGSHSSALLNGF